jgi:hypothetical protein
VESRHLQGCSPCLCRLRTDELALDQSQAGVMCPVNLVAICQQKFVFFHCLIDCYGREDGYGPADQTAVELWIVSGAILLGGSGSV